MIERVESADDPRLEPYRHVADPGWIREHDLFVAEGRLVVDRLIALARFDIHSILVNRAGRDALFEQLSSTVAPVLVCDERTLTSITGYNFHRGCLALVRRPAPLPPSALYPSRLLLGIESVANPDNIGGLFRTAAAFGAGGVLLDATSGDPLYRKAVRTSMGASLRLPYSRAEAWLPTLEQFRSRSFRLAALTPAPGAETLSGFAATVGTDCQLIVLVGAEGAGLAAETLAFADAAVRIPIDNTMDSLNVVVAAGIALERLRGCSNTPALKGGPTRA